MGQSISDKRMTEAVRKVVAGDRRVASGDAISVRVRAGVVELEGTVGSYRARLAAAEDAWGVEGATEVVNRLQVQPDRPRNPGEIAAEVAAGLVADDRVDDHAIVVEVAEGIVRLSGTAAGPMERLAAEERAWQVDGVVDVANDIAVSADHRRPDRDIEQDVRSALDEDARISDPTRITVRSIAGTVRLEGEVTGAAERQAAEKDAWFTAGVVYVENLLKLGGRREMPAAA